jgi:hypothetical protein
MAQGNDFSLLSKFNVGMEPFSWLERWESYMKLIKKPKDEEKPELLNHINTILPNTNTTPRLNRNRRSLLPFIGTISKDKLLLKMFKT